MEYRHSCRHVYVALGCAFDYATIGCALRWGVALVGDYQYWALLTPSWDPLSDTGQVQAADPHSGPHI